MGRCNDETVLATTRAMRLRLQLLKSMNVQDWFVRALSHKGQATNRSLEFSRGVVSATTNAALGECREPALDVVRPRCRGWREVNMEPRPCGKPALNDVGLVSAVVIHHEMDVEDVGNVDLDRAQELQGFAATVSVVPVPDLACKVCVRSGRAGEPHTRKRNGYELRTGRRR